MFKVPTLIAQFTHFCVACSTQSVYILSLSSTALPTVLWHPSRRKKIGTGLHKWICQCWNFWITVRPQEQPFSTVHKSRNKMKQTVSNSIKQYQTAKQNNNITQDQEVRPCQANKHHTIQTDTDHMASHVAIYLRRIGHPENRRKIWDPKSSKHKFQIIPVAHRLNDFAMHMPSLFL